MGVCVSARLYIYRKIRYGTHVRRTRVGARPIARRIHGSAVQVVVAEVPTYTRETHRAQAFPKHPHVGSLPARFRLPRGSWHRTAHAAEAAHVVAGRCAAVRAMSKLILEHEAYCFLFMHACKHPMKAVNGLLIGTVEDGTVRASKALPMFHSSLALAPMLEAALMLVRRSSASMPPAHARTRRRRCFMAGGGGTST